MYISQKTGLSVDDLYRKKSFQRKALGDTLEETVLNVKKKRKHVSRKLSKNNPLFVETGDMALITPKIVSEFLNEIRQFDASNFNDEVLDVVAACALQIGKTQFGDIKMFLRDFDVLSAYAVFSLMCDEQISKRVVRVFQDENLITTLFKRIQRTENHRIETVIYEQTLLALLFQMDFNATKIEVTEDDVMKFSESVFKVFLDRSDDEEEVIRSEHDILFLRQFNALAFPILRLLIPHCEKLKRRVNNLSFAEMATIANKEVTSLCVFKHMKKLGLSIPFDLNTHFDFTSMSGPEKMLVAQCVKDGTFYNTYLEELFMSHIHFVCGNWVFPNGFENTELYVASYFVSRIFNTNLSCNTIEKSALLLANCLFPSYEDGNIPLMKDATFGVTCVKSRRLLLKVFQKCVDESSDEVFDTAKEKVISLVQEWSLKRSKFNMNNQLVCRFNQTQSIYKYSIFTALLSSDVIKSCVVRTEENNSKNELLYNYIYAMGSEIDCWTALNDVSTNDCVEEFISLSGRNNYEVEEITPCVSESCPIVPKTHRPIFLVKYKLMEKTNDYQIDVHNVVFRLELQGDKEYKLVSGVLKRVVCDKECYYWFRRRGTAFEICKDGKNGKSYVTICENEFRTFARGMTKDNLPNTSNEFLPIVLVYERQDDFKIDYPHVGKVLNKECAGNDIEMSYAMWYKNEVETLKFYFTFVIARHLEQRAFSPEGMRRISYNLKQWALDDNTRALYDVLWIAKEILVKHPNPLKSLNVLKAIDFFMQFVNNVDVLIEMCNTVNTCFSFYSLCKIECPEFICLVCELFARLSSVRSQTAAAVVLKFLKLSNDFSRDAIVEGKEMNKLGISTFMCNVQEFDFRNLVEQIPESVEVFKSLANAYSQWFPTSEIDEDEYREISFTPVFHLILRLLNPTTNEVACVEIAKEIDLNQTKCFIFRNLKYVVRKLMDIKLSKEVCLNLGSNDWYQEVVFKTVIDTVSFDRLENSFYVLRRLLTVNDEFTQKRINTFFSSQLFYEFLRRPNETTIVVVSKLFLKAIHVHSQIKNIGAYQQLLLVLKETLHLFLINFVPSECDERFVDIEKNFSTTDFIKMKENGLPEELVTNFDGFEEYVDVLQLMNDTDSQLVEKAAYGFDMMHLVYTTALNKYCKQGKSRRTQDEHSKPE
ncbi:hypothetical protein EIN_370160 [Entamoeba invadens IP1]|uniref:Uncharacterized protein n=1 Tax=Entamoeba invadens IP1 TaxID=370355 RepID=A0A0A1UFH5_ENTIV|nr:hypothetical protein EIN_370160 [Entamoeba invadens IP1]ELP92674.1 hypothetical protein EIN_370160 [Entamoeba invadens IP1]|eukprot:XP_004259445.1 hypothetical protein EIN_370160 [Entamoeba invadens IP1]